MVHCVSTSLERMLIYLKRQILWGWWTGGKLWGRKLSHFLWWSAAHYMLRWHTCVISMRNSRMFITSQLPDSWLPSVSRGHRKRPWKIQVFTVWCLWRTQVYSSTQTSAAIQVFWMEVRMNRSLTTSSDIQYFSCYGNVAPYRMKEKLSWRGFSKTSEYKWVRQAWLNPISHTTN